MVNNLKVAVIGEGSWATAMVKLLTNNLDKVGWLVRFPEMRESLKNHGRNPEYLSDIEFEPRKLKIFSEAEKAINYADLVFIVLPSAYIYALFETVSRNIFEGKAVVSATKGLVPELDLTVSRYIHERFNIQYHNMAFVSGPSHAEELALERLTFLGIASSNRELAEKIQKSLACRYVKTTLLADMEGAEYATALKNVMAIGAGMLHGMGYGDNLIAVYVSYAIREIEHFLSVKLPADRNINDFVYLGDLLVTCYSQFSRNRTFGAMLGKGYTVKSAQIEMNMVAEGYYATLCIYRVTRAEGINLPIVEAMYRVLYERVSPFIEMRLLTNLMK